MAEVADELAEFVTDLTYDALPGEVRELAKLSIIDQLGVQLALSQLPVAAFARAFAVQYGAGPATIVGSKASAPPEFAAFANGVAGHAFELDDIHWAAFNHPGAPIVPAALAVCEEMATSGKRFVEAVVAGYEVMLRVCIGLGRQQVSGTRLCPVGEWGWLGSAVAAAKAWGLSREMTSVSIGLAASQAELVQRFATDGTSDRRVREQEPLRWMALRYGPHTEFCSNAGLAAMAGIRSGLLTRAGIGHPEFMAFNRDHNLEERGSAWERGNRSLPRQYALLQNGFKVRPYPGRVHVVIDMALKALAASEFADSMTGASAIHRVRVGLQASSVRALKEEELDVAHGNLARPRLLLRAALANALIHGTTLDSALAYDSADPAVMRLTDRIAVEVDAECDAARPKALARVRIEFENGQATEAVGYQKGSEDDPLTSHEVHAKFMGLAVRVMPAAQAEALLETLQPVEGLADVRMLRPLITTGT